MNTLKLLTLLLAGSTAMQVAQCETLSLTTNGRLTFTNAITNALYTIEWAPAVNTVTNLNGTNVWNWAADARDNWDSLKNFMVTGQTVTVEVPMFYRVKCLTNLFMPMPTGLQFIYGVSNAVGATSILQMTIAGCVNLSPGKEYSIIELLNDKDCALRLLPVRSTTNELYEIPFDISKTENVLYRNGSPGTTWTNQFCDGSSDQMTIESTEVITVEAGSFDCLKIVTREINNNLRLRDISWVSPGFGKVRGIDYGDGSQPPDYYALISWSDKPRH